MDRSQEPIVPVIGGKVDGKFGGLSPTFWEKMSLCKNLPMVSLPQKPFQAEKK